MHWWTDDQYWSQCKGCVFATVVGDIICEMQFSGFVQLGRWRCYVLLCLFVRHQVHKRGSSCKMCACGLHISASHYVYKYFAWSEWTLVLLLISDVIVISSLQVPPSTQQSLCRSQLQEILCLDVYWFSNIYLAQLCEDHNSSYRFLGLGLIGSTFWSPAGFYLIILFWRDVRMSERIISWGAQKRFSYPFLYCKVSV